MLKHKENNSLIILIILYWVGRKRRTQRLKITPSSVYMSWLKHTTMIYTQVQYMKSHVLYCTVLHHLFVCETTRHAPDFLSLLVHTVHMYMYHSIYFYCLFTSS